MVSACICTIGDEILIGQVVDTNSAYISAELNRLGIKVSSILSIGDCSQEILFNIERALKENSIVITTGGLGPTKDDITKKCLALLTKAPSSHYDNLQLGIIHSICERRGIETSELNREQASVPDNSTVILNYLGTAPGLLFRPFVNGQNRLLFSLPGVPYEMENMFPEVVKIIKEEVQLSDITHKTLITYGMAEAALSDYLEEWENQLPVELKLAYLPNPLIGIRLRLSVYDLPQESAIEMIGKASVELKQMLGNIVYGSEDDTLAGVLSTHLRRHGKTLSIAESCTGGVISSLITSIPGASEIYNGGVVSYSNESKIDILKVKRGTISRYGAVSSECALEMAEGARKIFGSDYAIATTGIAGPSGESSGKQVGSVWIAISGEEFSKTKYARFAGDRIRNINRFSAEALNFLRLELGIEYP